MRKITTILGTAAAAGLLLASAGQALAATVSGPNYTDGEVAYEIASPAQFNSQRATFTIAPNSLASYGVGFQQNVNGGKTVLLAVVLAGGNYYLESAQGTVSNDQTGSPFGNISGLSFHGIASLGHPASTPLLSQATGGRVFLETRQSTRFDRINFIFGSGANAENDAAVLDSTFSGVGSVFHAPFMGAFSDATTFPVHTVQASVTRGGITQPSGHGQGGTRVTFDHFSTVQTLATLNGGAPTTAPANPLTLVASPALPGVGSAWTISTP